MDQPAKTLRNCAIIFNDMAWTEQSTCKNSSKIRSSMSESVVDGFRLPTYTEYSGSTPVAMINRTSYNLIYHGHVVEMRSHVS